MISNDGLDEDSPENTYDYRINVTAAGPNKGKGHLMFVDATGDVYNLGIKSTTERTHYVRYSSKRPEIIAVIWYDDDDDSK